MGLWAIKQFLSTPSARRATGFDQQSGKELTQFLSTPSARRATNRPAILLMTPEPFLSTPSARRATRHHTRQLRPDPISIHALREEGDLSGISRVYLLSYFYPRPPRGGRPLLLLDARAQDPISIHALREEGDVTTITSRPSRLNFYPRPPRGGRRRLRQRQDWETNFYPRPPRGGRPTCNSATQAEYSISIHALREEGDITAQEVLQCANYFYPRPPRGGRRPQQGGARMAGTISIHALREEGDWPAVVKEILSDRFLSTPSARRATFTRFSEIAKEFLFLSTPSARRATNLRADLAAQVEISIHALREEGDQQQQGQRQSLQISIHALREEGDRRRR